MSAAATVLAGGAVPAIAGPTHHTQAPSCETPASDSSPDQELGFGYDHVLGTSMDMLVRGGSAADAHAAVKATLGEIDRLAAILSTRDPQSEISRLISAGQATHGSPEIRSLLEQYRLWSDRTGGVVSCQSQPLLDLWRQAETEQRVPDDARIASSLAESQQFSWSAGADGSIRLWSGRAINLDALGKAFIIDRALAAAVRVAPALAGVCLNIGGDIAVAGGPWIVGIASPFAPADNAAPLTHVTLTNQAIATSAGYERAYTIDGRRYSHILDPRTGRPACAAASSAVIAADAVTANALALAMCILGPRDGASLISRHGAAAVVVEEDQTTHEIGSVPTIDMPARSHGNRAAKEAAGWPADHQVTLGLVLKEHPGRRSHRPYVAVWVEDANRKAVRTLAVWGNDPKYLRDLFVWSKAVPRNQVAAGVTRATRQPGTYAIAWDGLDDAGKPLPAGKYTLHVEINREHGTHAAGAATIDCGGKDAGSAKIAASEEAEEIVVDYAKKEAK
jgi:thiamine biosynthesis lipoprotein ApbE